jgi:cytochrome o ubiquinol oxidase operon protein cyoD
MNINPAHYFEEIGAWPHGKVSVAYITGLLFSIIFTVAAYLIATNHELLFSLSYPVVVTLILMLAVAQFVAQLIFFLHLGREPESRTRLMILGFTLVIVAILVSGSIWIMFTLNQRMMPSNAEMEQYMQDQTGI